MPKTPLEEYAKKKIQEAKATAKMDRELSKFGTPVRAGMVWSRADLARFFEAQKKKR